MKNLILQFLIVFFTACLIFPQSQSPKEEFRAAWISTVTNIDWPTSPALTTEKKIESLISIIDLLKETNLNALVFQVRPSCDALYASEIEPWSSWLTGRQGTAPEPLFDPLEIAVKEAHKRGMELHAWINPYRVKWGSWNMQLSSGNVATQHPDWVLNINGDLMLDPGLPEVRQHVTDVIADIIDRYDVDGIHFDDYFYVSGVTNQDDQTFANYSRGFTNRNDWRRDNVNELLRMVHALIQSKKPYIKFGQSPAGIWKNGVPTGTTGRDNYSVIYCDAVSWLDEQIIDYLTPQLYWPFGGGQDYAKLMPWWVSVRNNRHIMPGLAFYKVGAGLDATQIGKMIALDRNTEGCYGEVYFTTNDFIDNNLGVTDTLKNHYYRNKSIVPVMDWKDSLAPNPPQNIAFQKVANSAVAGLSWETPNLAADGDSAQFYIIYHSVNPDFSEDVISNPENILDVTGERSYIPKGAIQNNGELYFAVATLDRNSNESMISDIVKMSAPETPVLVFPDDQAMNQFDTTKLVWNYSPNAASYELQVSGEPDFVKLIVNEKSLTDSTYQLTGMKGETKYYWRVKAKNIIGETEYSPTRSFTTGFPVAVELLYPQNQTIGVEEFTPFTWKKTENADKYRIQVVNSIISWLDNLIILDVEGITDTTYTPDTAFELKGLYSWRVMAGNEFGYGQPSPIFKFQVTDITSVDSEEQVPVDFELSQNYPNPFNPVTNIKFQIPEAVHVKLTIYDILGREVVMLINEVYSPGSFNIQFNGNQLPSGLYMYRIQAGEYVDSKKMILLK